MAKSERAGARPTLPPKASDFFDAAAGFVVIYSSLHCFQPSSHSFLICDPHADGGNQDLVDLFCRNKFRRYYLRRMAIFTLFMNCLAGAVSIFGFSQKKRLEPYGSN
jgi:hypothetical protein